MIAGTITLSIAYLFFIPWSLVFPDNIAVVISAVQLFAIGQALVYSNFYIVFALSYMKKSAVEDYKYPLDDILTDTISSFAVLSLSIGKILGSIFSCGLYDYLGIEIICEIAAGIYLLYSFIFALRTDVFLCSNEKEYSETTSIVNVKSE
jgi:hypothetical protein